MIHWLVGSLADHPDLARGEAPPELLSPAEEARLGRLRLAKRRRDWILGRWTAKHLVQSALEHETRVRLPFRAFTVDNAAGGAPVVVFEDPPSARRYGAGDWAGDARGGAPDAHGVAPRPHQAEAAPDVDRLRPADLSLSISHAEGQAFCALTLLQSASVGADIEWITPRHHAFAEEYFAPAEMARLHAAPAALYDSLVTVIWSAKEAVLKALGLGLIVDTRSFRCLVDPPADAQDPVLYGYRWSQFAVDLDPALPAWGDHASTNHPDRETGLSATGWWQIMSNYALTLVLIRRGSGRVVSQAKAA